MRRTGGFGGDLFDDKPRPRFQRAERNGGGFRPRLNVLQEIVERAAVDEVREFGRVFVLPPQGPPVDEKAVVGAVARDHRQLLPGRLFSPLAGEHLAAPACLDRFKEVNRIALIV
jgi:hypothetical protein